MTEVKLRSKYPDSLKHIIENALAERLRELENGIKITEERIQFFEQKYQLSTEEFLRKFASGELQHRLDLEFDEWIGEAWMLEHLRQDMEELRGIEFVD